MATESLEPAYFDKSIPYILAHEGGYSNNLNDAGGETNFGITKRVYPHLDIKNLTREEAIEIYRKDYWRPVYDEIEDWRVAAKIFDMAVNMGHTQAHRILQRAIHANADGVFGPVTLALANSTPILLEKLCEGQASFYMGLVGRNPSQSLFLKGWLKRAAWRPE